MKFSICISQIQKFLAQDMRIRDVVYDKFWFCSRCLDADSAVIKKLLGKTFDFRGDILDSVKINFRDSASKEVALVHVDQAIVGDKENIQIKIYKVRKKEQTHRKQIDRADQNQNRSVGRTG